MMSDFWCRSGQVAMCPGLDGIEQSWPGCIGIWCLVEQSDATFRIAHEPGRANDYGEQLLSNRLEDRSPAPWLEPLSISGELRPDGIEQASAHHERRNLEDIASMAISQAKSVISDALSEHACLKKASRRRIASKRSFGHLCALIERRQYNRQKGRIETSLKLTKEKNQVTNQKCTYGHTGKTPLARDARNILICAKNQS